MNKLRRVTRLPVFALAISVLVLGVISCAEGGVTPPVLQAVALSGCGLSSTTFCETFNAPAGTGNRSGQLNGVLWGVSRTTSSIDFGQNLYNAWSPTQVVGCSGTVAGRPDATDVIICNGQVREASTDAGVVTALAMYPKQPFDFADRTGKVTFDVSNDTSGSHGAWPEFWITDQPVPAPFTHEASWVALPRNGFGIRFAGFTDSNGNGASCPEGSPAYMGVDSVAIIRNYVDADTVNGDHLGLVGLDCVKAATATGQMNHYEIDVAQNQIDVYGTDAGTTTPLKHLATISNANLSFTRGLLWLEDVHYNGNKFGTQGTHTFAWDNVGFDGPMVARDLTFDAPDALTAGGGGTLNLGWLESANQAKPVAVTGVNNIAAAQAALLTFNFFPYTAPTTLTYVINGHSHSVNWPYPETTGASWRTLAVPVVPSELVTGTNTVSITSNQAMVVSNVDIVLAGAGGGAGPTSTAVAVPTNTDVPLSPTPLPATATAIATQVPDTCSVGVIANGTPTTVTKPPTFCVDSL